MECLFSEPQEIATGTWAFSRAVCEDPHFELIQNASTSAEFFIEKKVDYGDIFLFILISILGIVLTCKIIWGFFWKK